MTVIDNSRRHSLLYYCNIDCYYIPVQLRSAFLNSLLNTYCILIIAMPQASLSFDLTEKPRWGQISKDCHFSISVKVTKKMGSVNLLTLQYEMGVESCKQQKSYWIWTCCASLKTFLLHVCLLLVNNGWKWQSTI